MAGKDFPVMIKLGVEDGFDGGLKIDQGAQAAQILAEKGFAAIEVSVNMPGELYEGTEFRGGIFDLHGGAEAEKE